MLTVIQHQFGKPITRTKTELIKYQLEVEFRLSSSGRCIIIIKSVKDFDVKLRSRRKYLKYLFKICEEPIIPVNQSCFVFTDKYHCYFFSRITCTWDELIHVLSKKMKYSVILLDNYMHQSYCHGRIRSFFEYPLSCTTQDVGQSDEITALKHIRPIEMKKDKEDVHNEFYCVYGVLPETFETIDKNITQTIVLLDDRFVKVKNDKNEHRNNLKKHPIGYRKYVYSKSKNRKEINRLQKQITIQSKQISQFRDERERHKIEISMLKDDNIRQENDINQIKVRVDKLEEMLVSLKKSSQSQMDLLQSGLIEKFDSVSGFEIIEPEDLDIRTTTNPRETTFSLQNQITQMAFPIWDIPEISQRKENGGSISTEYFNTLDQEYQICLEIWPNGRGHVIGSYMSIQFWIGNGQYSVKPRWPFKGSVAITIANKVLPTARYVISKKCKIYQKKNFVFFHFLESDLVWANVFQHDWITIECIVDNSA